MLQTSAVNSVSYDYVIPSAGSYSIYVAGRNVPGSFSGDLVRSQVVGVTAAGIGIATTISGVKGDETIIIGQAYLSIMGFPIGNSGPNGNGVDAIHGNTSKMATKAFQILAELTPTAEFNDATLAKMKQYVNSGIRIKQLAVSAYNRGIRLALNVNSIAPESISAVMYYAIIDESSSGVPAEITVAQYIQETGCKHVPIDEYTGENSRNLFGIKPDGQWRGKTVTAWTTEWSNKTQKFEPTLARFSAYDSYEESVSDHSAFLTRNSRYSSLFNIPKDDPQRINKWASGLLQAGYATDPLYAQALINRLIEWGIRY